MFKKLLILAGAFTAGQIYTALVLNKHSDKMAAEIGNRPLVHHPEHWYDWGLITLVSREVKEDEEPEVTYYYG